MTDRPRGRAREAERDVERAIEEAEPAAEEMEQHSAELEEEIEETERDWEAKQRDESVPGAQEPLEEQETHRQDVGGKPGGEER